MKLFLISTLALVAVAGAFKPLDPLGFFEKAKETVKEIFHGDTSSTTTTQSSVLTNDNNGHHEHQSISNNHVHQAEGNNYGENLRPQNNENNRENLKNDLEGYRSESQSVNSDGQYTQRYNKGGDNGASYNSESQSVYNNGGYSQRNNNNERENVNRY